MKGLKVDTILWQRPPIPDEFFGVPLLVIPKNKEDWPHIMCGEASKEFPSDRPAFLPVFSQREMPIDHVEWYARAPRGPVYLQEADE